MLTVAETAVAQKRAELDKALQQFVVRNMRQAEFANTGRVDQVAARREMKEPGRCCGMSAFTGAFGKGTDA